MFPAGQTSENTPLMRLPGKLSGCTHCLSQQRHPLRLGGALRDRGTLSAPFKALLFEVAASSSRDLCAAQKSSSIRSLRRASIADYSQLPSPSHLQQSPTINSSSGRSSHLTQIREPQNEVLRYPSTDDDTPSESEIGWWPEEDATSAGPKPRSKRKPKGPKPAEQLKQEVSVVMIQLNKLEEGGERKLHHVLKKYAKSFGHDVALESVRELVCRQDTARALEAFEAVRTAHWYTSDPSLYSSLIRLLARQNRMSEAESLFQSMTQHGCERTSLVYTSLIEGYAKQGDVERTSELLSEMKRSEGCFPDTCAYNAAMRARCRAGHPRAAEILLEEMTHLGIPPDTVTYNVLIEGYAYKGDGTKAKEMFRWMVDAGHDPDLFSFNALIRGLGIEGRIEEMENVFVSMQMAEFGFIAPDPESYHCLIEAYAKWGLHDKLMRTVHFMVLMRYRSGTATWNAAIGSLAKGVRIKDMEKVFKLMRKRGIPPNTETFYHVLNGYQYSWKRAAHLSVACSGVASMSESELEANKQRQMNLSEANSRIGGFNSKREIRERVKGVLQLMKSMGVPMDKRCQSSVDFFFGE